jgi:hypothetical protein
VDIRAKTLVVLKKDTPYKAFRWTEVMGSEQLDDSHLRIRFHHHRECVHNFNLLVWWGYWRACVLTEANRVFTSSDGKESPFTLRYVRISSRALFLNL